MNSRIRIAVLLIIVATTGAAMGVFLLNSQPDEINVGPASNKDKEVELTKVAENLEVPWSVVFYGETALVSLRNSGQIIELADNGSYRLIGTVPGAVHRDEGGLLGLAIDDQQRLYAYYTTELDNQVARFELNGEPGSLSLGESEIIIKGLPSGSTHNGGRIAFGPDNLLYVTVGDARNTEGAQDLSILSGKILRMTPDGDVPEGNPFSDSLVYSYGHRNPQGIAWSDDGTMYSTEFGQNTWDELNVIEAGSNYGWPIVEGIAKRDGFVDPVQQWNPNKASPSGMAYANGLLYIANLRGEVLRTVPVNDLDESKEFYSGKYGRLRDVVSAPDGRIWFVTNNTDGRGEPGRKDDRIFSIPTVE